MLSQLQEDDMCISLSMEFAWSSRALCLCVSFRSQCNLGENIYVLMPRCCLAPGLFQTSLGSWRPGLAAQRQSQLVASAAPALVCNSVLGIGFPSCCFASTAWPWVSLILPAYKLQSP